MRISNDVEIERPGQKILKHRTHSPSLGSQKVASVTVIIPCYNCEGALLRAVDSVFRQTLRPERVILVEDASTDGTFEKIRYILSRYPDDWIRTISIERNAGAGNARYLGWMAADTEYLAFLDADDAWHTEKIELQYTWMRENPDVALSGHRCRVFPGAEYVPSEAAVSQASGVTARPIGRLELMLSNRLPTSSVMLRRDIPYAFSRGRRFGDDYLLWLQICLAGERCVHIRAPLLFRFKHYYGDGGLSGNLWSMERGELEAFWQVCQSGSLAKVFFPLLASYSLSKYLIRLTRVLFRLAVNKSVRVFASSVRGLIGLTARGS